MACTLEVLDKLDHVGDEQLSWVRLRPSRILQHPKLLRECGGAGGILRH